MSNNISQEAALVGHIAEKGAPGKDGKTPVKGVDYWTPEDKANIIHEVLESDEYQSVKGLVGTKEKPVNFNLLESGVYVFQGYISVTAAGETTTNTIPCPKELLLVVEQSVGTNTDNGLTYELYAKIGFLFHTDTAEAIFGDVGIGVLGIILAPSSIKFLGEWPEDKKNDIITKIESSSRSIFDWVDNWMEDTSEYVTRDEISDMATKTYVSKVTANMATEQYVSDAISNIPPPDFSGMATDQYVDDAIQQVSSAIELINSKISAMATTEYVDSKISAMATTEYVDSKISAMATTEYVDSKISAMATTDYVDSAISNITFPPSLTEDQVNALIDAKLGVIENGHY